MGNLSVDQMEVVLRAVYAERDRIRHAAEGWEGQVERDALKRDEAMGKALALGVETDYLQAVVFGGEANGAAGGDTYYEYGYRIDGIEVWQDDHGPEGAWIPWRPDLGIHGIDVYSGGTQRTVENIQADIWESLADTGRVAEVIRRKVTEIRGETEAVARTDELDEYEDEDSAADA